MRLGFQEAKSRKDLESILSGLKTGWEDIGFGELPTGMIEAYLEERKAKLLSAFIDNRLSHLNLKTVVAFLELLGESKETKTEAPVQTVGRSAGRPRKAERASPSLRNPSL